MEGKMYPSNLKHSVKEIRSPQAKFGSLINQFKDPQGSHTTKPIPCGKDFDFFCKIWIRRISADDIPSGTYYVGLFF